MSPAGESPSTIKIEKQPSPSGPTRGIGTARKERWEGFQRKSTYDHISGILEPGARRGKKLLKKQDALMETGGGGSSVYRPYGIFQINLSSSQVNKEIKERVSFENSEVS